MTRHTLKRLMVLTNDGGAELYVQIDAPGATLVQMCDQLRGDLAEAAAVLADLLAQIEAVDGTAQLDVERARALLEALGAA